MATGWGPEHDHHSLSTACDHPVPRLWTYEYGYGDEYVKRTLKRKPKRRGDKGERGKRGLRKTEPASLSQPSKAGTALAVNTAHEQHGGATDITVPKQTVPMVADRSHPSTLKTRREPGRDPGCLVIERAGNETMAETDARTTLSPAVTHSFLVRAYASKGTNRGRAIDATMAHDVIAAHINAVNSGDMNPLIGPLVGSVYSCQAMGTEFMRLAILNIEQPQVADIYSKIGLRCIAQMRANAEAVAEIKNPRPVFARQTNIASGPQQVNNAQQQQVNNGGGSRVEETENPTNKLLERE